MVSLWNARSYLKELKTNLKSSQSAPVFLLPRLTSLHYKFFAQSPPPAQASAPPPMPPTPPGGSKGWHHSCHRPDSPAQRLDGATMLKWRLTTNTGWRHLLIVDSRSKQTKKIPFSYHQIYGGFCSFQTPTQKICKNTYTYGRFVLF